MNWHISEILICKLDTSFEYIGKNQTTLRCLSYPLPYINKVKIYNITKYYLCTFDHISSGKTELELYLASYRSRKKLFCL